MNGRTKGRMDRQRVERTYRGINRRTEGPTDGQRDGWTDREMDGRTERRMDEQRDRRTDRGKNGLISNPIWVPFFFRFEVRNPKNSKISDYFESFLNWLENSVRIRNWSHILKNTNWHKNQKRSKVNSGKLFKTRNVTSTWKIIQQLQGIIYRSKTWIIRSLNVAI